MAVQVVVLAAGQGKRMHSHLPKVLHRLGGKPLIEHVLATATKLSPDRQLIVIYGNQGDRLCQQLSQHDICWILQKEQLGTGHAVMQALDAIKEEDDVLVLYGDVPLILASTLQTLVTATPEGALGLLTAHLPNPQGYGRVKRSSRGAVIGVVEEKDATAEERALTEINTGIYRVPAAYLKKWLPLLKNDNAQGEYYLTDIISMAVKEKIAIHALQPSFNEEIMGVNNRLQLAHLERFYQRKWAESLMREGVTISDPARLDIRGDVQIGHDVSIDVNVIFEGTVVIGNECRIGPHTILRDVTLADRVEIKAHSVIEGAKIAADCVIGPFARVRPNTVLATGAHIGNFVEIKNSEIGAETKINHLSYIGDSHLGLRVNIGAGTITCNYDGAHKHQTIIGDDVHIGSDTQLVAPVVIGPGATIGAGSTITKDVPPHHLTLTHQLDQRSIKEWHRPAKEKGKETE